MRIPRISILMIISLMLTVAGCGEKKEGAAVPSAFEQMRKNKQVVIITDARNAPFSFGKDTTVQGLDVDLGYEIGKTLGVEVKWVPVKGYNHLFELLKAGEAEIIISAIGVDPKWTNDFAFSNPYYETGDVIAHPRSVFDVKSIADLSGKQVGVGEGRPGDIFMTQQKDVQNVTIKRYPTLDDALGALNRSEISAVIGDEIMLSYGSFHSFQSTTTLPNQVNSYKYAAVVRKNETELLAKINETIDRMKSSGQMQQLVDQWIGNIVVEARKRGEEDAKTEARKKASKVINVNLTKTAGKWPMDRLDGFQLVLQGPTGRYQSTPILTEGNRGHCRFSSPVPPGDYTMNFSILGMTANVNVPALDKTSLSMDISIGNTISILTK